MCIEFLLFNYSIVFTQEVVNDCLYKKNEKSSNFKSLKFTVFGPKNYTRSIWDQESIDSK